MFVGVPVAIEGEGWMVRAIGKCYYSGIPIQRSSI